MNMNPSVLIGIPSGSDWKADFGMSLAGLMAHIGRPLAGGGLINRVQLWNTKGSILPRSRHTLVRKAQELECTHILFVDSDMTFPPYTLHQLLRHNKAVIGANCAVKLLPSSPTARMKSDKHYGELVHSAGNTGIQQVWRLGTGVMLIKVSVFEKLQQPWFEMPWHEDHDDYTGEDWTLCQRLEDAGIPIWVDHALSQHIGHIGSYTYTHADVKPKE